MFYMINNKFCWHSMWSKIGFVDGLHDWETYTTFILFIIDAWIQLNRYMKSQKNRYPQFAITWDYVWVYGVLCATIITGTINSHWYITYIPTIFSEHVFSYEKIYFLSKTVQQLIAQTIKLITYHIHHVSCPIFWIWFRIIPSQHNLFWMLYFRSFTVQGILLYMLSFNMPYK